MAKILWERYFTEYAALLAGLERSTRKMVIEPAVYEMANVVANNIREGIRGLPAHPDIEGLYSYKKGVPAPVLESDVQAMDDLFGISEMRDDNGVINVSIGFGTGTDADYAGLHTRKYPFGRPVQLIARGIESGSTAKQKHPFIRPAVNRARKPAIDVAQETINAAIEEIMRK